MNGVICLSFLSKQFHVMITTSHLTGRIKSYFTLENVAFIQSSNQFWSWSAEIK